MFWLLQGNSNPTAQFLFTFIIGNCTTLAVVLPTTRFSIGFGCPLCDHATGLREQLVVLSLDCAGQFPAPRESWIT
jgi:hypothetical protein